MNDFINRGIKDGCLFLMKDIDNNVHERCSHVCLPGRWVVMDHDLKVYGFSPDTQFQKDSWFSHIAREANEQAMLLRWICFECNTLQMP